MTDNARAKTDTQESVQDTARSVVQRLKDLYLQRLVPLESEFFFAHFHNVAITASELEAKPQVLLVGQYSTGKTTMIKWLIERNSKFFDIRPQPSTDRFVAVVHGEDEKVISGDAAACLPQMPYSGLASFGSTLLSKFQVLVEPAPLLEHLSFVDTPGVLSGEKQRISRKYEYVGVVKWLAERSDMILLVFDAHKLDISDEFKEVIEAIKGNGEKIRCVLNKADEISGEDLVKVYGALMWNLGKILLTPEVAKIHVGSFWDSPYQKEDLAKLLDADRDSLKAELYDLPKNAAVRKVNDIVARARALKVHMALVGYLRQSLPYISFCGCRRRKQRWLCRRLDDVYKDVAKIYGFTPGDLPDKHLFRQQLEEFHDFTSFPRWDAAKAADLDRLVNIDVPKLMLRIGGVSHSSLEAIQQRVGPPEDTSAPEVRREKPLITAVGVGVLVVLLAVAAATSGITTFSTPQPPSLSPPPRLSPPPPESSREGTSWREFAFGFARPIPAPLPPPLPPLPPPAQEPLLAGGFSAVTAKLRTWWS